jgi:hypothetical protein
MRRKLVLVALLSLTLAACGTDQEPAVEEPIVTTTTAAPQPGETTTTAPPSGFGTSAVSVPPDGPQSGNALLKAVRVAHQTGADRVVFEFERDLPGYSVKYVSRPITEDGSGNSVEVTGDNVIEVRMERASGADLSGEEVRQTYTGPNRINQGTPVVTELVRTGDFEAVLTWVIGVRGKPGFNVTTVTGNRLVIEVAGGPS